MQCTDYSIEINSIGSINDRSRYKLDLQKYLIPYIDDLDQESQTRLFNNTIRILDSKSQKTQEILNYAPKLINYLEQSTLEHFEEVTDYLDNLQVQYTINTKIVRGLDYYNKTAFEIKSPLQGTQDTICGGGRYDNLIEQIGGPQIPAVGWAIGIERLLLIAKDQIKIQSQPLYYYIATEGYEAKKYILQIIPSLQKYQIKFEIDFTNSNFQKQLKRANRKRAIMCLLISSYEVENNSITIKWLQEYQQESYYIKDFLDNLKNIKQKYY